MEYIPEKCWVGEGQKICYGSEEEAWGAAAIVEREHGLVVGQLTVYKCEFGDHWHLANGRIDKVN